MEAALILVALVAGVILGIVIGRLWQRTQSGGVSEEQVAKQALLEDRAGRVGQLETQLKESQTAEQESSRTVVQLQERLESLQRQRTAEQEARAEREAQQKADATQQKEDQERMVAQFKAAAHEIVEERSKAFDAKSQKSIGELVKPLKEQLEGFRKQLSETEQKASTERISLAQQVKSLKELNTQISDEARNLTRALKGDSKTRGNWGEMVLSRVLELSGLEKGREYETEVSETGEDGKRRRPDVIVQMPKDRQVVIDAKVSLAAYDEYCSTDEPAQRDDAMKRHVASIRTHVKGLSEKNYQDLKGITTIDYVLMFIPIEASFTEAMRADRKLYDEAIAKKVLIVTPSTLLAVLRTIETIWRHERQTKNALEIARQAGALYDKFVGFTGSLEKVGERLNQARVSYDAAFNQLSTGKGNLVGRAKKLEELGAKTSKKLSAAFDEVPAEAGPVIGLVSDGTSEGA